MLNKSHKILNAFHPGVDCATNLLDPELLVFLFLLRLQVPCLCGTISAILLNANTSIIG